MLSFLHVHDLEKILHLKDKIGLIYWHLIIHTFGISLIHVFVPIYLLTLGFSLTVVFLYLLLEWAFFGLPAPLYGKIIHKIGLKEVVTIRTPLLAVNLILLYLLPYSQLVADLFYLIPVISGFSFGLYWLSITSLFARYFGKRKQAQRTAEFVAFPKIASILAPTIGGSIAFLLGFHLLFIIVIITIFISTIPLSFVKKNIDHPPFMFSKKIFKFKEFIILSGYGIKTFAFTIILPIAFFFASNNLVSIGILLSMLSFISAFFSIYIGKITDRKNIKRMIRIGALLSLVFFFLIGFSFNTLYFLPLSFISGFIVVLLDVPYETHIFQKAQKRPLEMLVYKEFSLFWGRLIFFLVLIFFSSISLGFFMGGISSLAFFLF